MDPRPMDPGLRALLAEAGTAGVSDALDIAGVDGGLPGLTRRSGAGTVLGPAFTVRFEPVEPGTPAPAADYIDDVPPGSVVVLANSGITTCTVWGDILSHAATATGIAGTVIDGCCRDIDASAALGYSIWARGTYMKSGKNRARMAATQVPVTVAGARVRPGDLVVADGSGALVVPAALADGLGETVRRVLDTEDAVRAGLAAGLGLAEARRRHGYHAIAVTRVE